MFDTLKTLVFADATAVPPSQVASVAIDGDAAGFGAFQKCKTAKNAHINRIFVEIIGFGYIQKA